MTKAAVFPREDRFAVNSKSGRRIRQITSHPSIHHHPFFFVPAYDRAMRRLIFVSCRTGTPQIFFEHRASGELVQVTDRPDLADWSIAHDIDDDDLEPLCASEASNEGAHWGGPFPYNDGPVAVEAAQHTHPHPRFAPDNSRVLFTSDKTGHAQLYEVMLEDGRWN